MQGIKYFSRRPSAKSPAAQELVNTTRGPRLRNPFRIFLQTRDMNDAVYPSFACQVVVSV